MDGEVKFTEKMAILKYICQKYGPQLLPKAGDVVGTTKSEMLESFLNDCLANLVDFTYVSTVRKTVPPAF